MSVGQSKPPVLSPSVLRTPSIAPDTKSASPSYFGFDVAGRSVDGAESGNGFHARQNWTVASAASIATTRQPNNTINPDFELFRRQSERDITFSLNTLPTTNNPSTLDKPSQARRVDSLVSPRCQDPTQSAQSERQLAHETPSFGETRKVQSPAPMSPRHEPSDHQYARLSMPTLASSTPSLAVKTKRSDTVPVDTSKDASQMCHPQAVAHIIDRCASKTLVLDLRVYPQYAASRIRGALSLCIPTTLIKRPAFTVQKLEDTFTSRENKVQFARWREAEYIIVYDANSTLAKEAVTSFNVLKKFALEGWQGTGVVVKGGFAAFARSMPAYIDRGGNLSSDANTSMSIGAPNLEKLPVAGGCLMPATENAANPFFGNIRQNMDLLDGVGQVPITRPANMTSQEENDLPVWLRRAASVSDEGKSVSDQFLRIERTEQQRMKQALSTQVTYGESTRRTPSDVQIAGIEKGSKNRYNNIFPFEHSRVKLQNVSSRGCDYVNASYVKASHSDRRYIATQAPIPSTFGDFWEVVWEQEVRVIVMLTAEHEGGQVKSHPYWKQGEYGPLRVKAMGPEKRVCLKSKQVSEMTAPVRPTLGQRRSTTSNPFDFQASKQPEVRKTVSPPEEPFAIVRQLSVSHSSFPFQGLRDVTQIQYTQWPDFGAPASPATVLSLIDLVNKYQSRASYTKTECGEKARASKPILVHCSAGCGRTGTFCTIDTVIDMLKHQQQVPRERQFSGSRMEIDDEDEDWIRRDDVDLIAKAVEDFRCQRLSMVQNLRQFVLCYESILQWLHDERNK